MLPAHALAEANDIGQYSLTALLKRLGLKRGSRFRRWRPTIGRMGSFIGRLADRFPLRLSVERFVLYAVGLTLIGLAQVLHSWQFAFWDWSTFAWAAAHVGTPGLLHPARFQDAFVYLPAAAWALAPLRGLPSGQGFALNAGIMLCALIAAALVARRIYALSFPFCLAAIAAWAPATYAIVIGQNSPIGLVLILVSLAGFVRRAPALTAIPLALLLYKPTFAIPLVGVLVLQRRSREIAIVAFGALCWYLGSVVATGGDWSWPITLARLEHALFGIDFSYNATKAISLTALLVRVGVPGVVVAACAAFVVAASIPALTRVPDREAYAAACLLGLVVSPHAWSYDAVLVLPMLFVVATTAREPVRTRLTCAAYAVAPMLLFAHEIGFNPLLLVVCGAFAVWFARRWRSNP